MTCITEVQLRELFEDNLPPDEREPLEAHISGCAACRRQVVEIARGLDALEPAPAPPTRDLAVADPPRGRPLPSGSALQERYVVLDVVGYGGMGVVYAAYDRKLDRKVAIKLLRPEVAASSGRKDRLLREAQVVARLSHPNIIRVHDVGEAGGQIFIDMEFVDGRTLRQWLAREPRPDAAAILRVFLEAGRGLSAAHAAGVIHRDFKPDNVLVGDDGRVRVNDFGLARALARAEPTEPDLLDTLRDRRPLADTETGSPAGTPAYMAPEQRRGEPATAAADQYAFCVALHEALFGGRPIADAAGHSRIGGRERIRNLRLAAAIQRGLSPDPRARFPSMDALCLALQRATRRRWPALAAGVVATALGLAAAAMTAPAGPCAGAEARVLELWTPPRRATIERAFAATGSPTADLALARVDRVMDDFTREWVTAHRESCEATHVFHEQSYARLERQTTCLRRLIRDVDALLGVLAEPDAALVDRLPEVIASVGAPTQCMADDAPIVAPPPALRGRVEAHRDRIGEALALSAAGRHARALTLARDAAAEAATLGYPPSELDAALTLGRAQMGVGAHIDAEVSFRRALKLAESLGLDGAALEGWLSLAWSLSAQVRYDEATAGLEHAEAKVARLRDDSPLGAKRRADVVFAQADLLLARGRATEALEAHRRALALRRGDPRADPTTIARSLNALGNLLHAAGDGDGAMIHLREALAIRVQTYGPDHPRVAGTLNNLGRALQGACAFAEARATFERALEIRRRRYGDDHAEIAAVLSNLAALDEELGRHAEATTAAEASLTMLTRLLGEADPHRAGPLTILARLRLAAGDVDLALALADETVQLTNRHLGEAHPDASEPLLALGEAQHAAGRHADAEATLERAAALLAAHPSRPEWRARASFALARIRGERGDLERARAAAAAALTAMPTCRADEAARIAEWIESHPGS